MQVTVRRATIEDLDQIRFLFRDTIIFVNAADYQPEEITVWSDCYQNTNSWMQNILSQYFLVAIINNKVLGFSSIDDAGYLDFMYIHRDFQRQGIANLLLTEIEQYATQLGLKEIFSHVSKTAQPFFLKSGYLKTGVQINRLKEIEFVNAVMTKKIN